MDYEKGYLYLFNAITDALKVLDEAVVADIGLTKAKFLLKQAQCDTEEMYMSEKDKCAKE